ncbi:MAG TPA: 50S ribosomal protein L10 [Clostridia bacterium]|nr:50S ribosomal protein L10 [Clostridia bacterium]
MNKQRQKKEQIVAEIREKMENSSAIVLTDYRGLNVGQVTKMRADLRKAGVEFKVLKNTLTRLAARETGLEGLEPYLEGPTALAFSKDDPTAPAKILMKYAKEFKTLEIKAGVVEGKVIDPAGVKALADLPSREELLAQVLRGMQSPLAGFAGALNGLLRNFVCVLDAVRQKKAEAEA